MYNRHVYVYFVQYYTLITSFNYIIYINDRCILGVLSNHGSLELSIKDVLNWTGVFDIGIEWKKHLTNVWSKKESSVAFSRELFLERFKQLRIVGNIRIFPFK